MDKKKQGVLYVAFHFPPILGSSGVHRTLAFTRHLAENGWDVNVLTSSIKAYDNWSEQQFSFIPKNVKVIRAFARNAARSFSFKGKYLSWMAFPDNWQSWIVTGILSGLKSIWVNKPKIIISTYPIASAHIIAYVLHKISGVPWVADLRDPMAQDDYPTDLRRKKLFEWIEKKAVKHCKYILLTAPGAVEFYQQKFPHTPTSLWQLIPNGYDAEMLEDMPENLPEYQGKVTLLHSGVIYPSERDPSQFFEALSELKAQGEISSDNIEVVLRASGHVKVFQPQLERLGLSDIVTLAPSIPYKQALTEMFEVNALLLLQADNCDYQIPAKAYEYIRTKQPILALTSAQGDTGQLLSNAGVGLVAPLTDKEKIKVKLGALLTQLRAGPTSNSLRQDITQYSRQYHARKLEEILEKVI